MLNDFLLILSFLTTIPVGRAAKYNENSFRASIVYFPLIGNIIGILNYLVYIIFGLAFEGYLLITFIVLSEFCFSGALHLDGLADTFDGFFSARSTEKKLEIMKDSRIGTHGVLAIVFCVLFKIFLLYELRDELLFYIIAMPIVSRGLASVFMYKTYYPAEHSGIASPFIGKISFTAFLTSILLSVLFTFVVLKSAGIILIFLTLIFNFNYKNYCISKIGGITGDIIGGGIELSEIIFLLSGVIYKTLLGLDIVNWFRTLFL